MFSLTSAAARQIQEAALSSQSQHLALRVAARLDQQGEVQYGLGFDEPQGDDQKLELEGVSVVIREDHQVLLDTIELDFVEMKSGEFNFIFIDSNPASSSGGGCGSCGASVDAPLRAHIEAPENNFMTN
jgi:iron-sulfur cluster assembly protein